MKILTNRRKVVSLGFQRGKLEVAELIGHAIGRHQAREMAVASAEANGITRRWLSVYAKSFVRSAIRVFRSPR